MTRRRHHFPSTLPCRGPGRHVPTTRPARAERAAFTLVEAMLALVTVCLVAATAMEATGMVARSHRHWRDRQLAQRLAESMLDEVLARPYPRPAANPVAQILGGATNLVGRTGLLHIDAYHQLTESPPTSRDGTVLTSEPGWTRSVHVFNVQPLNPSQSSVVDTGLKRVVVTVSRSGRVLATASSLKAADD